MSMPAIVKPNPLSWVYVFNKSAHLLQGLGQSEPPWTYQKRLILLQLPDAPLATLMTVRQDIHRQELYVDILAVTRGGLVSLKAFAGSISTTHVPWQALTKVETEIELSDPESLSSRVRIEIHAVEFYTMFSQNLHGPTTKNVEADVIAFLRKLCRMREEQSAGKPS